MMLFRHTNCLLHTFNNDYMLVTGVQQHLCSPVTAQLMTNLMGISLLTAKLSKNAKL